MLKGRSSRSRNFFRKFTVNAVTSSKTAIKNDCLLRFYDADAELKAISSELDSFDGKKDPIRCNLLVNRLRASQDKVISLLFQLMDECNCERASRDYRMKFPDEILLSEGSESLNGQIWFGAECLSAGSNILNHTKESTMLRPMAKTLTTHLDSLRNDLRDLVNEGEDASRISDDLIKKMVGFDHVFATFEYEYVKTMLPIRTVTEIEKLQEVAVLFSETLIDSLKRSLIKQDDIDEFQPIVMIAIPRLAIVRGLLYKNENPIYTKHRSHMCNLFQPFHGPLYSIRQLLRRLNRHELYGLEKMLSNDQSAIESLLYTPPNDEHPEKYNQPCCSGSKTRVSIKKSQNVALGSAVIDDNLGAGTSSDNYSNALVDRIQYPISYARCDTEQAESTNDSDLKSSSSSSKSIVADTVPCYPQPNCSTSPSASASSPSSSISSNNACNIYEPRSSTSSTHQQQSDPSILLESSSMNSPTNPSDHPEQNQQQIKEDDVCPLSSSESDAQLAKLIEEFSPSIESRDLSPSNSSKNTTTTITINQTPACDCDIDTNLRGSRSRENSRSDTSCVSNNPDASKGERVPENDAMLEELYLKQTQQLLHKLFVAISGVADQLQSNFASDLRFILRHIFISEIEGTKDDEKSGEHRSDGDDDDEEEDENNAQDLSEGEDYSSSEQSNSSIPIERGIEAHEVTNLIDLSAGYEVGYDFGTPSYVPSASSACPFLNQDEIAQNLVASPPSSSSVNYDSPARHPSSDTPTSSQSHSLFTEGRTMHGPIGGDIMSSIVRDGNRDAVYDNTVSPNEPTIGEAINCHRHRHQHSAHPVSSRYSRHRHANSASGDVVPTSANNHQITARQERRSRNHHTGASRSRRSNGPPVWVPDELVVACSRCNSPFTFLRRRHHCRACGQIFCANCSRFTKNLNCWGYNGQVRVCESCFDQP